MKKIFLAIMIACCVKNGTGQIQIPATANFAIELDWLLHPRFVPAHYTANDQVVNGYSRLGHFYIPGYVNPVGYGITLKALISNQAMLHGTVAYQWEINGITKDDQSPNPYRFTTTTEKRTLFAGSSTTSDLDQDVKLMPLLPFRGKYSVRIIVLVKDPATGTTKEFTRIDRSIEVRDILIVAMGDSFASGEGNPDTNGDYNILTADQNAIWWEANAHRSLRGALSLLAARVEADDPHSSVTFINVATSGAKTSQGLLFQQHPYWQKKGQIAEVKDYIGSRKVDMILLSIGLNDFGDATGMSALVIAAANPVPPEFVNSDEFGYATDVARNFNFRYDEVHEKIQNTLHCDNVILFQVPVQFMRNERGDLTDGCGVLKTLENEDIVHLETLGNELIAKQKAACSKFRWGYVDGIAAMFRNHGYCAGSQSWFISITGSRDNQGDVNGGIHPNNTGHQRIADLGYPLIKNALQVRTPNVQTTLGF